MSNGKPILWRGFDRVERLVGSRLEDLVATTGYADTVVKALKAQRAVGGLIGRVLMGGTSTFLHAVNLPTGKDVQRLSRQLASLTGEVRALSLTQQPGPVTERQASPAPKRTSAARAPKKGSSVPGGH